MKKLFFKFPVVALVFVFLLFNACEKDDSTMGKGVKESFVSTVISYNEIMEIQGLQEQLGIYGSGSEEYAREGLGNYEEFNEDYNFIVNTSISTRIYNDWRVSYTFHVYREQDNGLLENLVIVDHGDGTFTHYLAKYNLSQREIEDLENGQWVDIEGKLSFEWLRGGGLPSGMTAKCDYNSSICYDYYSIPVGCRCASGLHTYSDGAACSYWQNNDTDNMATQSGCTNSFVIPVACSSCQGGGNGPGSPPSPTPHPGSGGGSTSPTISCKRDCPPVLEYEADCDTSKEDLKKVFPNIPDAKAELLASIINNKGTDFGIDSKEKLWHFLAQTGHETGGYTTLNVTENMNYTTAARIAEMFSSKFHLTEYWLNGSYMLNPYEYTNNPEALSNVTYCCQLGNGNEASGDGWKYRGRGIIQLTYHDNYRDFKTWYNSKYDPDIDPVTSPDIIASNDTLAILSGMWYYKRYVLQSISIDSTTTVDKITKKINRYETDDGKTKRRLIFQKAKDSITCK